MKVSQEKWEGLRTVSFLLYWTVLGLVRQGIYLPVLSPWMVCNCEFESGEEKGSMTVTLAESSLSVDACKFLQAGAGASLRRCLHSLNATQKAWSSLFYVSVSLTRSQLLREKSSGMKQLVRASKL